MKTNIFPAIRLTLVCTVFFCFFYNGLVWGVAQLMPDKGAGTLLTANGKTYYENVGQKFDKPGYFWSRPSAVDYNAAGSGGSNKGPSNPGYLNEVETRIEAFLKANPTVKRKDIPADLVTASGSGLDPNISVEGAQVQVERVASERNVSAEKLRALIATNTEKPLTGAFGPSKINVLKLNIALENLK
ncbi:MAG TPA: K(+)-transporting ATPase subunit C [Pelobium sp.]|nr:K(+)-transporting ATPase subunit C [Pelobium sp.]